MFDLHKEAFLNGHFRVEIESRETPEGFVATWRGPNDQVIEVTDSSQSAAHRLVTDKLRDGVLNDTIVLGR